MLWVRRLRRTHTATRGWEGRCPFGHDSGAPGRVNGRRAEPGAKAPGDYDPRRRAPTCGKNLRAGSRVCAASGAPTEGIASASAEVKQEDPALTQHRPS